MSAPRHRGGRETARLRVRADRPTVIVAALSSGLGTIVVTAAEAAERLVELGERTGESGTVAAILPVFAWVFTGVALYVSAVVASNTCATVVAGRTRSLALQRVLGASGAQLRGRITGDALVGAIVGAALGTALGVVVVNGVMAVAAASAVLPPVGLLTPVGLVPVALLVVAITTGAFRLGSRTVLSISPLLALEVAAEGTPDDTRTSRRSITGASLFVAGGAGIGAAIVLGATNVLALLLAVACGALSFTGIVVGAPALLPAVLRLVEGATGGSIVPSMAARNSVRTPERTARAMVGLLIAVTLTTTFAVGFATYARMLGRQMAADPEYYRGVREQFDQLALLFAGLIGAAGVIAATGVVTVTALTIAQRGQELALLRVIGASTRQVRALVLTETAMTIAVAAVLGVLLGTGYGWAGAYTLLGTTQGAQLMAPVLPAWLLVTVVVGAACTGLAAAAGPARRVVRSSPVEALHAR